MRYQAVDQVLTPLEVQTLLDYNLVDDHVTDARPDVRSKNPIWDRDDFPQDILQRALDQLLPDPYEVETVWFFQSKISFKLHVDSGVHAMDPIYRNVLLPLDFSGPATTILFDNHYHGPRTKFARSNIDPYGYNLPDRHGRFVWIDDIRILWQQCVDAPSTVKDFEVTDSFVAELARLIESRHSADPRSSDYNALTNLRLGSNIDQHVYQQYLNHIPPEDLDGLSVDTVYQWKKGGALTFPRTQLHCAGAGHEEKIGITIFTRLKTSE